jgi:hypothetical protein
MELDEFLVKAKINGYASSGEGGERILEDRSKELIFEENNFKYRDRYFGFNPFIGEEIVWKEGEIIWGMHYYGRVLSEEIPAKEIYEFLKEALRQVRKDKPFRGPESFKKEHFEYVNEVNGSVEEFCGIEKIFYNGKEVYRLVYHGGSINK